MNLDHSFWQYIPFIGAIVDKTMPQPFITQIAEKLLLVALGSISGVFVSDMRLQSDLAVVHDQLTSLNQNVKQIQRDIYVVRGLENAPGHGGR